MFLKLLSRPFKSLYYINVIKRDTSLSLTCTCLIHWESQQKRFAGHSKWANIKFKKMHKDNARAKMFGQLSREIIQAVKGKKTTSIFYFYNVLYSLKIIIIVLLKQHG